MHVLRCYLRGGVREEFSLFIGLVFLQIVFEIEGGNAMERGRRSCSGKYIFYMHGTWENLRITYRKSCTIKV